MTDTDNPYGCLQRCTMVSRSFIRAGALLIGCGIITCEGATTSFGNGVQVPLGLDGDGRNTGCYAEITVAAAADIACNRSEHDAPTQAEYAKQLTRYAAAASSPFNVIQAARVSACPRLCNVFLGAGAQVTSSIVENSTILSSTEVCFAFIFSPLSVL